MFCLFFFASFVRFYYILVFLLVAAAAAAGFYLWLCFMLFCLVCCSAMLKSVCVLVRPLVRVCVFVCVCDREQQGLRQRRRWQRWRRRQQISLFIKPTSVCYERINQPLSVLGARQRAQCWYFCDGH